MITRRSAPAHSLTFVVGLAAAGCGSSPPSTPGDSVDAAAPAPDAAPLPPFPTLAPAADAFGVRRGLVPARGIMHLHSVYSHDACDGDPRDAQGGINEPCALDLRAGLCATRMDFAALSDHDDSMADEEFITVLGVREGDELWPSAEQPIAMRITCENGQVVTVYAGGENDIMPLMIDRHPDGTVQERHDLYNAYTAEAMQTVRDLGGLAWLAHTEKHSLETLRALEPDGIEIYNLHANLDPRIREERLGLDPTGAIRGVIEFADSRPTGPEPDLALISFLSPNDVSLDRWDALLGDGRRVTASAGTDAHENAFAIELRDGERGDSYRRMMRWFSNVALVEPPADPAKIEAAVAAGRLFVAFELFGTPSGFDVDAGGTEMGGALAVAQLPVELTVSVPQVYQLDPSLPAPAIRARVLRIDAAGQRTEIAAGPGPTLTAELTAEGMAYRVEVLITPNHMGPYLGDLGPAWAQVEYPWVYSNPIYITH